jgi:hypothetical protein
MLVSVLVDTYNHERFLREALDSVFRQESLSAHEVEIIVVDDGSTDATPILMKGFGDRIKYIRKDNGGQGSAFNVGIRACRGDLIAFLDGDDWWHPRKLASVLSAFARDPGLVAVGHGIFEVDQVAGHTYKVAPGRLLDLHLVSPEKATELINNMACLGTSRLTARREVLLSLLDVPEDLVYEADEYLFTLLPACGRVAVLPDCLTYYRIHSGNLYQGSRTARPMKIEEGRLRTRAKIYACLSAMLPAALRSRGCSREIVDKVMTPVDVAASRLRLQADGGGRWENFRSEARAARLAKPQLSLTDALILALTLFLTILVPPKRFFSIRSSYSDSALRRMLRGPGKGSETP